MTRISIREAVAKFLPQSFNDFLALAWIAVVIVLWILQGMEIISLRDDVNGALTVLVTLVVQFYFRRAPVASGNGK